MDFDMFLKGKALDLAAMEQLELSGKLTINELFVRAKDIYNKGYEHDFKNWKTFWKEGEEPVKVVEGVDKVLDDLDKIPEEEKKALHEVSTKEAKEGFKICPKCGEDVRETWMMHRYKKDGTACGYKWEEDG